MPVLSCLGLSLGFSVLPGCSMTDRKGGSAPIVRNKLDNSHVYSMQEDPEFSGQDLDFIGSDQLSDELQQQVLRLPRKVFFGFDSFALNSHDKQNLNQNATFMLHNPDVPVMITGHTDPRGSQSYNFHLGQRRANIVEKYLESQGVPKKQICVVSYGELRPAVSAETYKGGKAKAYRLDRRSEVIYNQSCQGDQQ